MTVLFCLQFLFKWKPLTEKDQANITTKEPEATVLFEGKNWIRLKLKHDILKFTVLKCK